VEEWRERFLLGAENALRARPKEDEALRVEGLNRLKRKVGELTIDLDIVREANRLGPIDAREVGRVTATLSRGIDAQSVSSTEISRGWLRARGMVCGCGTSPTRRGAAGTDPRVDRKISDLWLSGLWALLRFGEGIRVNRNAIYRMLRLKGWFVHQHSVTPRPRVQGLKSPAQRSDQRCAMDVSAP
jgi:hypothetical protein